MVVVYRVSSPSWWLGQRLVRTPYYSMVNLVAGRSVVPELIQGQFQPEAVAHEARQLLENPAAREQMQQGLREVAGKLEAPHRPSDLGGSESPARTGVAADDSPAGRENRDPVQRFASVAESILKGEAMTQT